jgi:hypothetical protein
MPNCETESCCTEASASKECCPCGTDCGGDPVACAAAMWQGAFFQALRETHVEALKSRLQKAWGPQIDKAADAVLEAMGAKWESMLAQSKAKADLHTKLSAIFQAKKP